MTWSLLAIGALLLVFPADKLMGSTVSLRTFDSFQNLEDRPGGRPWWWVPILWLDPLRAFAGLWLVKAAPGVSLAWLHGHNVAYWGLVLGLALAVTLQSLTRREPDVQLAPIGFVGGIVAALLPWPAAVLSLVLAIAALFALRSYFAFFVTGLIAVPILGVVLKADMPSLIPAILVLGLPVLLCLTRGATMEIPAHKPPAPPV